MEDAEVLARYHADTLEGVGVNLADELSQVLERFLLDRVGPVLNETARRGEDVRPLLDSLAEIVQRHLDTLVEKVEHRYAEAGRPRE